MEKGWTWQEDLCAVLREPNSYTNHQSLGVEAVSQS